MTEPNDNAPAPSPAAAADHTDPRVGAIDPPRRLEAANEAAPDSGGLDCAKPGTDAYEPL